MSGCPAVTKKSIKTLETTWIFFEHYLAKKLIKRANWQIQDQTYPLVAFYGKMKRVIA